MHLMVYVLFLALHNTFMLSVCALPNLPICPLSFAIVQHPASVQALASDWQSAGWKGREWGGRTSSVEYVQ